MSVKDSDDETATTSTWITSIIGLPIAKVINTDDVRGSREDGWRTSVQLQSLCIADRLCIEDESEQFSDKPTPKLLNPEMLRHTAAFHDRRFLDAAGPTGSFYCDCLSHLVGILCILLGIYILNLPDLGRVEIVIGSSLCCLPLVIWLLARVRHVHR